MSINSVTKILFVWICCSTLSCNRNSETEEQIQQLNDFIEQKNEVAPEGMRFIPAGNFYFGAVDGDTLALEREFPKRNIQVSSFYIDEHEVTNAQFAKFVNETGYVTIAERPVNWNELKQTLPPNTPKPADTLLVPGSLVFTPPVNSTEIAMQSGWWKWVPGANWKHPEGPNTSIEGKDDYPVVHIAYTDALRYALWAGKRLPTEAEWTWAAKGGNKDNMYPWGNEHIEAGKPKANHWTGDFPIRNTKQDGFIGGAPVKSFAPNAYGLYDLAGNVWEITGDKYDVNQLRSMPEELSVNPRGAKEYNDPNNPLEKVRVMKGGSYLCNDSYCASYRISARMAFPENSSTNHTGFRCVKDLRGVSEIENVAQ